MYSLKADNKLYKIYTIGTDTNPLAVGKHFCDHFEVIPSFKDTQKYLDSLIDISTRYSVDVILPQNTLELSILADNKNLFDNINTKVLISNKDAINKSNNKYNLMQVAEKIGIPCPSYVKVDNIIDLEKTLKSFGWPKKKVVIKPPLSNGSRGVRIIDEGIDLKDKFFTEKPGILSTNFEIIKLTLGASFDTLLVMEYLPGQEYSVDVLRVKDKKLVIPRSRTSIKSGITFSGRIENNKLIEKYSIALADALNLRYCFGFQFILKNDVPYIIECNPRVQGSMVISTLGGANIILNSVLDLISEDMITMELKYDTIFTRYWGGISENVEGKKVV
jgi:carbamoyl-phosphate synthase large subunit